MSEVISRKQLPAKLPTVAEIQKRQFSAQFTKLMWESQPDGWREVGCLLQCRKTCRR